MNSRPLQPASHRDDSHSGECAFAREHLEGFALDALDSFERGIVEHHLRWCPACRSEAARYERAVSLLRDEGTLVSAVGEQPCVTVDSADTAIEVNDFWMLLAGRGLPARNRRVLTAVAMQAAGLVKQRELSEEAGKAEAISRADELRRSLAASCLRSCL